MNLQNIDCKSDRYNTITDTKAFNLASECVESLYLYELDNFDTGIYAKINIVLHDKLLKFEELPSPPLKDLTKEQRQERMKNGQYFYQNQIEKQLEVLTVHRLFNFKSWDILTKKDKKDKKQQILEEIHNTMLFLAKEYGWDIDSPNNAYYKCLLSDIENSWLVKNLKLKKSQNKKYKAGIIAEFDIDEFRFYAVIYSFDGTLIRKELIHNENGTDFPLAAESIIKGKTIWSGNEFILKNSKNIEVGKTIISDSLIPYLQRINSISKKENATT